MEIGLRNLKDMPDAERKALGVVRVPHQSRQQLDKEIPGLGGQMCTGGNQRCLSALFPGHKDATQWQTAYAVQHVQEKIYPQPHRLAARSPRLGLRRDVCLAVCRW